MPLHRFLNFVYRAMLQRLDYSKEGEDVRGNVDRRLEVSLWRTPGRPDPAEPRTVNIDGDELNAPAWWRGDEEASNSFLASMGVTLQ